VIKLVSAPIRGIVRFPLFQLAIVVAIILWLQSADDKSAFGEIFNGLDKLVSSTVDLCSAVFSVKSFTKSWLISGFMIAYVYLACLLILFLARLATRAVMDVIGRSNAFGLRSMIARERGIAAYRAWLPLERIRPNHIPREQWEETFAWPANDRPPYRPLTQRIMLATAIYALGILIVVAGLWVYAPSVLRWLGEIVRKI
jgi:thiosulfate reductase cytochrome b subunit